jgi:GDP-L-fucose synthase
MKYLVAGASGLVGSAIVRELRRVESDVVGISSKDLNLLERKNTFNFIDNLKPDVIIDAAAKVGGINYNAGYPADFIYDNLMIQANVINAAYKYGVKKLLFLGSACIYPKVTPQPIKEEYLLTAPLEPTNEGYALAKIAGLKMCDYYRKQYGFNAISLMPANLYGPNDNFDPEKCHVIPGMITKFNTAKVNGTDVTFWGDGTPTREFLYVDDLADACLFLMQNYNDAEHINVGSDVEIEIRELCETIRKEIEAWTGEVCKISISTGFNYFIKKEMEEKQMKAFVSENFLRNLVLLVEKCQITQKEIEQIDKLLKDKVLPYSKAKYPLSAEN